VRDDDCGDDVLRIGLVRRQGDPVAAQGVLPRGADNCQASGGPVSVNDTRIMGAGTGRRPACRA
jgi:hypothetical protein